MNGSRQKTRRKPTRAPIGRSEAPVAGSSGAEPIMTVAEPESPTATTHLMEEVCDRENLVRAWQRVRGNKGAPGVDGMTIDDAKGYLREHWPDIRSHLLAGSYRPQPVKRVEIPKPDGGVRKLGVPCVVDRLIQQALHQVLMPLFDPGFSPHSYGFRPGRSAPDAVKAAKAHVAGGQRFVVDMDLETFLDTASYSPLVHEVCSNSSDCRVITLMRSPFCLPLVTCTA